MARKSNTCLTVSLISFATLSVVGLACCGLTVLSTLLVPSEEAGRPVSSLVTEPTSTGTLFLPTVTPTLSLRSTNTPELTPEPVALILDLSQLLNAPASILESQLGAPGEILPFSGIEIPEVPGGGESRDYLLDDLWIFVFYDRQGLAKNIVVQGLGDYGYTIDEWPELMERLGFPIDSPPDRSAPAGREWANYNGFGIWITSGIGEPISVVKVYVVP